MKSGAVLLLAIVLLSVVTTNAQYFRYGGYRPFYGGFRRGFGGGGFGGGGFGPRWGQGRGLAFLGSAALLGSGSPFGRAAGGLGLASLLLG